MKRALIPVTAAVYVLLYSTVPCALTKDAEKVIGRLEQKAEREIVLPNVRKGVIPNGIKYYFLTERELPLVRVFVIVRGGSAYDAVKKTGLTAIAAALLRSGGAGNLGPDELDEKLDRLASTITIDDSGEYISATMVTRSENFDETMDIFLDILFSPRFDAEKFDLIKKRAIAAVKRRKDSPEELASIGFRETVYGGGNPWGTYITTAAIDAVTVNDVKIYHKTFFHPENMIFAAAGDISPRKFLHKLKSYGNYPEEKVNLPPLPSAEPEPVGSINIIDKEATQSVLNIGHVATDRFDPAKYALIVMNDILGGSGSFKKRLPQLIRVKMGLAYTVWSSFGFGPKEAPGLFKVFLATKNSSAKKAFLAVKSELERFAEGDISEEEVSTSKRSILGKVVFEYASAFDIVSSMARFNFFGYPDNYIEMYSQMIRKVALDDVVKAAKEYLHPNRLKVVIVGPKKELEESFKKDFKVSDMIIRD